MAREPNRTPLAVRRAVDTVAASLTTWRKLRGLTQAQLADRAGISRSTLARLEDGDGGASTENLLRVLRALGIMDLAVAAIDPQASDLGRARVDETLPKAVRPTRLGG